MERFTRIISQLNKESAKCFWIPNELSSAQLDVQKNLLAFQLMNLYLFVDYENVSNVRRRSEHGASHSQEQWLNNYC